MLDTLLTFFGLRVLSRPERRRQRAASQLDHDRMRLSPCSKLLASIGLAKAGHWPMPSHDSFYGLSEPASALTDRRPGDVIAIRPFELAWVPGFDAGELKAWQIAYVTSDEHAVKQRTVTTIIVPPNASYDKVVAIGSKTDAAVPDCRTSYGFRRDGDSRFSLLSEFLFMDPFLRDGAIVNVPDYMGGKDAFGSKGVAGRAMLDSLRAVIKAESSLGFPTRTDATHPKMALYGYSAGAQAVFSAAEVQQKYAPDLNTHIVGYTGGGLPVKLADCARHVDGSYAAGLIIGMLAGLSNANEDLAKWLKQSLTAKGRPIFEVAKTKCWVSYMIKSVGRSFLTDGYFNVTEPLETPIVKKVLDSQTLGGPDANVHIAQPILLSNSVKDEVIPIQQVDDLVQQWGKAGSSVEYTRDETYGHTINCFTAFPHTVQWIRDRFAGKAADAKPGEPLIRTVENSLETFVESNDNQKILHVDCLERLKKGAELSVDKLWWD